MCKYIRHPDLEQSDQTLFYLILHLICENIELDSQGTKCPLPFSGDCIAFRLFGKDHIIIRHLTTGRVLVWLLCLR